jgi:pectinesterase
LGHTHFICRVIFKNTALDNFELNPDLWSAWGDNPTGNIFYADYNTPGTYSRPDFAHELDEAEAAEYNIASALGSNYADWVDAEYL